MKGDYMEAYNIQLNIFNKVLIKDRSQVKL